ncbi:MAG TPA: penicillin acylase family protein [Ktedonobacteraceae bacterium]|nr:penicillin acylase family protein [Ktedonobacteraceae bacterium]
MASWWKKTLLTVAGVAGATVGAYYLLMRRPVPKKKGEMSFAGLHETVEIIVDRYGVPHIYAQNEDDLYFAQGYMHAQERLWQMEFNRRIGSGRLSEIFGEIALEVDRFSRRLGMHRSANEELSRIGEHSKRILDAYALGVNASIEQQKSKLPIEFTVLRCKPKPWQASDSILWAKMMGWNLGGNWETEVVRAHLVAKLGPERAAQLETGYDPLHPLIIPPGVEYQGINLGMLEQYEQLKQLSGFGMLGASNNWVVDGTMTVTGSPILCNDPHLGQAAPSIWYECHLVAGDIDVVGASFPGAPGVVIGHNKHIAWGVTNAISDVEDLYIEKFNPQNPHQYEFQGQWEEAQVIREEIVVKGKQEPVVEEVLVTRHGPILTTIPHPGTHAKDSQNGNSGAEAVLPLALRWTGLEQCHILEAIHKLSFASDWEEFRDAMRDWDVPAQNVIYADDRGNIGYIMAGAIPMRTKGQALLPSPGWTGEYEWTGLIPFDELPQTYNPEQHFIVTANNRVINDDYPHYITHEWLNGYRAQRIRDLLTGKSSKGKLAPSDMAEIQSDQYSLPAVEIVPHMLRIQTNAPLENAALDILRVWDFILQPDSAGAAIYTTFLNKLERIVFGTVFGDDESLMQGYLGIGTTILAPQNGYASRNKPFLIRLLNTRDEGWFANSAITNGPHSWDAAIASTFTAAVEELREKLGDNIARWQYGKIHRMTYSHPIGNIKPLDKVFNRGPFPIGGDIDTVNMGASLPNNPEVVVTVPSFRQIVNLADVKSSLSIHAPGQSGHPASKHYDDFIKPWLRVEHHPMLFERSMIEANAEGNIQLEPEK